MGHAEKQQVLKDGGEWIMKQIDIVNTTKQNQQPPPTMSELYPDHIIASTMSSQSSLTEKKGNNNKSTSMPLNMSEAKTEVSRF